MTFNIRMAERRDCAVILELIQSLADYERMSNDVMATAELLEKWLFDEPVAEVLIAEQDEKIVAYALYFHSFSTFLALPGIYLEDLFVHPEYRGRGIGTAMLAELAHIVVERGYGRLEWACLDWNKPSIDLYLSFGVKPLDDWTTFRLAGDALQDFAKTGK
jgi:GNAT superfamily N-acetyltransferase